MPNPIFNMFNGTQDMVQRFNQFRQQFQGNPQQIIQNMVNSGKISQEQYNNAVQQANMLRNMFKL